MLYNICNIYRLINDNFFTKYFSTCLLKTFFYIGSTFENISKSIAKLRISPTRPWSKRKIYKLNFHNIITKEAQLVTIIKKLLT